jgi:hypothetical protein
MGRYYMNGIGLNKQAVWNEVWIEVWNGRLQRSMMRGKRT